jgi:phosphate transport system protein
MATITSNTHAAGKRITNLLVAMALKVEEAVDHALGALLNSNTQTVTGVLEREAAINEMEIAVDRAIFAALERGDLSPEEIRPIASALKINKDLERLGDLAANIGRKVSQSGERRQPQDYSELQPLAIAVSHVCRQTLRALTRQDLVLANNVLRSGAAVDDYRNYVFRRLRERADTPGKREGDVHLMFASRYLEQIADHAVNLAEKLVLFLNEKQNGAMARQLAS